MGVARPSAHGQAMISTATAAVNAWVTPWPAIKWPTSARTATTMTTGTKTWEILSTSRCTGAWEDWASLTSCAICASVVFSPTRVASTTRRPDVFNVAPVTTAPSVTSTGTDSPVNNDASIAELPLITRPSVATFSPGRTTK